MKQRTPLKQINSNINNNDNNVTTKPIKKSKSKRKKNDDDDDEDDEMDEIKTKKNAKLNSMIASATNNAPATTKFRYVYIY